MFFPQALGFLNYLMLGTSASPLRKALNDSGLGESIIGGGIEDELRQPVFSLGLKVGAECLPAVSVPEHRKAEIKCTAHALKRRSLPAATPFIAPPQRCRV